MSALIILSEGAEELETITIGDVLVRGGVKVTMAGLQAAGVVKCSRGFGLEATVTLADEASKLHDVIVLPGGLDGAKAMQSSSLVKQVVENYYKSKKLVAAICAAPIALQTHGIGLGKRITSYPSFENQLSGFTYSHDKVVVDGNLVTSRGPGTAMLFALKLVELLKDKETATKVGKQMLVDTH